MFKNHFQKFSHPDPVSACIQCKSFPMLSRYYNIKIKIFRVQMNSAKIKLQCEQEDGRNTQNYQDPKPIQLSSACEAVPVGFVLHPMMEGQSLRSPQGI